MSYSIVPSVMLCLSLLQLEKNKTNTKKTRSLWEIFLGVKINAKIFCEYIRFQLIKRYKSIHFIIGRNFKVQLAYSYED